jgi:hypothetical protein
MYLFSYFFQFKYLIAPNESTSRWARHFPGTVDWLFRQALAIATKEKWRTQKTGPEIAKFPFFFNKIDQISEIKHDK